MRSFVVASRLRRSRSSVFAAFLAPLRKVEWVVYAKKPFGGPQAVLAYLSRTAAGGRGGGGGGFVAGGGRGGTSKPLHSQAPRMKLRTFVSGNRLIKLTLSENEEAVRDLRRRMGVLLGSRVLDFIRGDSGDHDGRADHVGGAILTSGASRHGCFLAVKPNQPEDDGEYGVPDVALPNAALPIARGQRGCLT
jgi:hypothetical protein